MLFKKTKIKDCYQIDLKKLSDDRGFFSRMFCLRELKDNRINIKKFVQSNNSLSKKKGTFRGFHFQNSPYQEDKLIRCVKGEVFNICLDLRKNSKTYLKYVGLYLSEKNNHLSFEHTHPPHEYIQTTDRFKQVNKLKKQALDIIGKKNI